MDNSFIITPDKLLELADNYISRYGVKLDLVPDQNIFFLHGDNMRAFMFQVLPRIDYKFVLITHDADAPVTEEYLPLLDHPNLLKWFGMNCHILHEKLHPIPIGMANEVWPHGNKDVVTKVISENNKKENLVYCNFDINTNFTDRNHALTCLKDVPFIDFETSKLSFEDYLRKLSTYKYVISPPGNSVDCHRIWESMYVGTIPICLKSIPLVTFKDCPILFINKWEDITTELLEQKYDNIKKKETYKSDFNFYKKLIIDLAQSVKQF